MPWSRPECERHNADTGSGVHEREATPLREGRAVDQRPMRVTVGADHAGYDLKEALRAELLARGHDAIDLGTHGAVISVDYPDYGAAVGRAVAGGEAELGVCVCGSGSGISMAANKVARVRAAVVHDVTTATLAKEHGHAKCGLLRCADDGIDCGCRRPCGIPRRI